MALTATPPPTLGAPAPAFDLPAANPGADGDPGERHALADYADAALLLVVFTCNHCPYARHVEGALIDVARDYRERGVATVAISSNDADAYPADGVEAMAARAAEQDYPFPYLYDEDQSVARAYGAVCTPDVFVFDAEHRLAYRGRFDGTRPGGAPASGDELRAALDDLLRGDAVQAEQRPATGCSIKWKRSA